MKILLVDNHTRHIEALKRNLAGHDIEVATYRPGAKLPVGGKNLIILSGGGGEGREVHDRHRGELWYKDELQLILDCPVPILGICMGFELMAHAYGSKIEKLGKGLEGPLTFRTKQNRLLTQYESHDFGVRQVSQKHYEILAESDSGIEIIRHKTRPLLGVQFHPELPGTLKLNQLIKFQILQPMI